LVGEIFGRVGIIDLSNTVYSLDRAEASLHFGGVDDIKMGKDRLDMVLDQLPTDGAAILLAHEPDFADATVRTGRFDLQISGHSHGGQVIVPLIGPLVLPELGQKYPLGLYELDSMYQYTNRGVGMSEPAVRFNCRPVLTIFTFKSPRAANSAISSITTAM
jgi:predicted MPP superfamily phosphohydrolase